MKRKYKKVRRKYDVDRTVIFLNNRKYKPKPIPEVGKRYHCFDDGKITFSRHFIIKVDEVLGFMQFKKKYPEMFKQYIEEVKSCYWLYKRSSDKFVVTFEGENDKPGVYVRTKDGGWFGIGDWWNSARLDVTGQIWKSLIQDIDLFDYTDEEKKQLIEENTINGSD